MYEVRKFLYFILKNLCTISYIEVWNLVYVIFEILGTHITYEIYIFIYVIILKLQRYSYISNVKLFMYLILISKQIMGFI